MVDSALPSENPLNASTQQQPGPEGDAPATASEATPIPPLQEDVVVAPPAGVEPLSAAPPTAVSTAELSSGELPAGGDPSGSGASDSPPIATTPAAPFASLPPESPEPSTAAIQRPTAAEPEAEAVAPSPPAGIASTLSVPPLEPGVQPEGEGGEFELLISRLSQWLKEQNLPDRWEGLQGPLRGLALLLLTLVVLRLYGALIATLNSLPLVPRLLQLVGVIVLVQFSLANLVRTSDRERLFNGWLQRWATFRGRV